MRAFGPKGLYFRVLDYAVRLVQSDAISTGRRLTILAAVIGALVSVAWMVANALVVQVGELPGTTAYDRLLFSYLMRLVCGEAVVIGGIFLSALWAQQAGRIPRYGTPADERE